MSQLNLIGTTLGRFEVLSELGRGGMAVVYKARQTDLDRIVALKILPPEMTHDTSYIARFRQEARSAARLEHPHIMPIYEVGEIDGLHHIAMKFIQGRTLKELVQEDGALSVRRAAEILAQVGDALDYAHRHNVIHRDIKPSNIMITDEGWVYLTDFGLARGTGNTTSGLTMAGTVMGTPEYMSPEQAQGLPTVGPPTDIYALGVVLYELLTGTFPFHAETPMAMLAARLLQAPIPPRDVRGDLPTAVEDVVMRALARKPEARFTSAAEMVAALRAAAGIGPTTQAQAPLTPVGGIPAIGETIITGKPTQPTPPYIRPQASTTPVQMPQLGTLPTPQPALPHGSATPGTKPKAGMFIGIGAAALVLIIAMVGGIAMIKRPGPTPTTVPTSSDSALTELIQQSDAALAVGDISTAISGYQQVTAKSADNIAALSGIALAYNMDADWAKAEQSANVLINAALADDRAAALGLTLLADAIASQGNTAEASELIQQALDLNSNLSLTQGIHSNIMAVQAGNNNDTQTMDQALAEADTAVDSLADETTIIQALTYNAIAVTFAQDYGLSNTKPSRVESEADYEKAITLIPNAALFHANLGNLYSTSKDYTQARDEFDQALTLDPTYTYAQIGIGWIYYDQDQADKAAEAFDAAMKLNPDEADVYYAKGRLAYDKGDYDTAISEFQNAAQRNHHSASIQAWLGESHLYQGFNNANADQQKQAYASAEQAYQSALQIDNNYAFALRGLGWILQYQEKYTESVDAFQQALKLDEHNDDAHNGLGWSLFNLEHYDAAEPEFRRAIEIAPKYASAHYGLGRTLEELGHTDEARSEYQQALDIEPSNTDVQNALDRLSS